MKKIRKKLLKSWQLYVLLFPAIIYTFVFDYLPMYGVQIAFRDYSTRKGILNSAWVGLAHFRRFVNFPNFSLLLKNTLSISMYALLTFPCAIIFALMINELRNEKFRKIAQMISYFPFFLSTVVICSMISLMLNYKTGVINNLLSLVSGNRIDFLTTPAFFNDIYVWSDVWQNLGWNSIIYVAVLSDVSQDLVEAARIDGAGRFQIIQNIYIPHMLPTIMVLLILNCGKILSVGFEKAYLLQNPLNLSASQLISTYVYEIGIKGGEFSYSAAIGLFNNIANLLVFCIVAFLSKRVANKNI